MTERTATRDNGHLTNSVFNQNTPDSHFVNRILKRYDVVYVGSLRSIMPGMMLGISLVLLAISFAVLVPLGLQKLYLDNNLYYQVMTMFVENGHELPRADQVQFDEFMLKVRLITSFLGAACFCLTLTFALSMLESFTQRCYDLTPHSKQSGIAGYEQLARCIYRIAVGMLAATVVCLTGAGLATLI